MEQRQNQPEQPAQTEQAVPYGRIFCKGEPHPSFEPIGKVKDDETGQVKFGVALTDGTMCPVVVCFETDQAFVLEWSDILRMAIDRGVDRLQLAPANDAPKLILPS